MKIGIIGAGNIGATLARKLAAGGHEVKLANSKRPDTIGDLARDVGAIAVSIKEFMAASGTLTHDEVVNRNRAVTA